MATKHSSFSPKSPWGGDHFCQVCSLLLQSEPHQGECHQAFSSIEKEHLCLKVSAVNNKDNKVAKEAVFDEVEKKIKQTNQKDTHAHTFQKKNLGNLKFGLRHLKLSLIHVTLVHRENAISQISRPLRNDRPL